MGNVGKAYGIVAALALLMLAATAVTVTARVTNAGSPDNQAVQDTVVPCSDPNGVDNDANEQQDAADTDNVEEQCGPQDEAGDANEADEGNEAGEVEDANEQNEAPGTIDDGAELLPQAGITLDQAIAAAQGAAQGSLGEVDLEDYQGKLAFNVEIGKNDVKVDAQSGAVLNVAED